MSFGAVPVPADDLPDLDRIRDALARYVPRAAAEHEIVDTWQAATALVVAPGEHGPELVLIERVRRGGDPWSGDMALPGGKREPDDPDLAATAVRETREEVGIALGHPVGRLDDHEGRRHAGRVATYAFVLDERPAMTPHPDEVADALWVPLAALLDPAAAVPHHLPGYDEVFPAIDLGGRVVWGLTHRTLATFLAALGLRLPPLP
ncbi:CoA pyrophosphatase [Egicoccus sp. AB-alg6-2]|uniref:NUDIX hydrolase n=1 Tax=Egicoccus sp. AB-alg6-2 TaxID=3242692 RepID=UPI00359EC729